MVTGKAIVSRYHMTAKCPNCAYSTVVLTVHADGTLSAKCHACKEPIRLKANRKA